MATMYAATAIPKRAGQHLWAVPGGALHRPHRHSGPDDGAALLPMARAGHHVMVGGGVAHRHKMRGRAGSLPTACPKIHSRGMAVPGGACGFGAPAEPGISARQFVAIATQSTFGPGTLGSEQSNDRPGAGGASAGGGPAAANEDSWLSIRPGRRLCPGTAGVEMTPAPPLRVQRPEQPMHRQPVPPSSRCALAQSPFSAYTALPQPDGRGPGPAAGPGCLRAILPAPSLAPGSTRTPCG